MTTQTTQTTQKNPWTTFFQVVIGMTIVGLVVAAILWVAVLFGPRLAAVTWPWEPTVQAPTSGGGETTRSTRNTVSGNSQEQETLNGVVFDESGLVELGCDQGLIVNWKDSSQQPYFIMPPHTGVSISSDPADYVAKDFQVTSPDAGILLGIFNDTGSEVRVNVEGISWNTPNHQYNIHACLWSGSLDQIATKVAEWQVDPVRSASADALQGEKKPAYGFYVFSDVTGEYLTSDVTSVGLAFSDATLDVEDFSYRPSWEFFVP